jgi:hydrogenase-4 component G
MRAFAAAVAERARTSIPLGAYAGDGMLHYCFLERNGPEMLSAPIDPGEPMPALGPAFPVFAWDEREMADDRGVRFDDPADARPFFARDGLMPEAIVAHGSGVMQVVVGPVHAGIIEPGRFTFSSGGETVVHLDAQLGYAHRGVERALEGRSVLEAAPLIARICGSCSAAPSIAYARLVLCELERILNHLGDLAMSASGAAWVPGFTRGMALKERAMRICAAASGHRLLFDAIVPGGIGTGVLADPVAVGLLLEELEGDVEDYLDALFGNASVISRWRGAGVVSHATAAACGAVGPPHRASGGDADVRRTAPYGGYRDFQLSISRAHRGDAFARCRVKRGELRTSFGLIAMGLAAMVERDVHHPVAFVPPAGIGLGCVEGPRGAELVAVHVDADGCIGRFHLVSASYRNWPLVARAMDGNIIPDFPLVNKSFNLCYACADR